MPPAGREFKDAVFSQFARIAAAFGSPKRIELIDLLAQGERPVEALAREAGLTLANTSRHLQVMKAAGLVTARKAGLQVFYRLADALVLDGYRALQALAEARLAEVGRLVTDFFSNADGLEPVRQRHRERRLADLPRGQRIVAYCRGPYCVLSAEAVRRLRRRGREAERLKDGYPEWRDAGLPVAVGLESPRRAKRR